MGQDTMALLSGPDALHESLSRVSGFARIEIKKSPASLLRIVNLRLTDRVSLVAYQAY